MVTMAVARDPDAARLCRDDARAPRSRDNERRGSGVVAVPIRGSMIGARLGAREPDAGRGSAASLRLISRSNSLATRAMPHHPFLVGERSGDNASANVARKFAANSDGNYSGSDDGSERFSRRPVILCARNTIPREHTV
jgi:hypothetical protein